MRVLGELELEVFLLYREILVWGGGRFLFSFVYFFVISFKEFLVFD